jgi:hypothetical protein
MSSDSPTATPGAVTPGAVTPAPHMRGGEHPLIQRLNRQRQQSAGGDATGADGRGEAVGYRAIDVSTPPMPGRSPSHPPSGAQSMAPFRLPQPQTTPAVSRSPAMPRMTATPSGPPPALPAIAGGSSSLVHRAGGRTPTQRQLSGGVNLHYDSIAPATHVSASSINSSALSGSGARPQQPPQPQGPSVIKVLVRVPGLKEPVPVTIALIIDAGSHRSGPSNEVQADGNTPDTPSLANSLPAQDNLATSSVSPLLSGAAPVLRQATASDLADAFVPALQAMLTENRDIATVTAVGSVGGAQVDARTKYTPDAGAFDASRWQFAHRSEFLRPHTVLQGRVNDGDLMHGIFSPRPSAGRRGVDIGAATDAAAAAAHTEGQALQQQALIHQLNEMATMLRQLAEGAASAGQQSQPDPPIRTDASAQPALGGGGSARPPATDRDRRALEMLTEALAQTRRAREELSAMNDAAAGRPAGRAGGGRPANASQQTKQSVEEDWDEASIAQHVHAKWAEREETRRRRGTAYGSNGSFSTGPPLSASGSGASTTASPDAAPATYDPLRDPDAHAGQRVVRLVDDDGADGADVRPGPSAATLTRIPGVTQSMPRDVPNEMRRYISSLRGPSAGFLAMMVLACSFGPFNVLMLTDATGATPRMLLAMCVGGILNVFLTFFGALEIGFSGSIAASPG